MKKIFLSFLLALVFMAPWSEVQAAGATMSLTSSKNTFKVGETFKVSINVQPNGNELQLVRAELSFPADKLEATNFDLNGLFPNLSPGKTLNNVSGTISVGGYRLGDSIAVGGKLGDITFKVKAGGAGTISFLGSSHMITPDQEETFASAGSKGFTFNPGAKEESKEEKPAEEPKPEPATPTLLRPSVSSSTHPSENQWFNKNDVNFTWVKTIENEGYALNMNRIPNADPGATVDTKDTTFAFQDVDDGVWYFHVKTKYKQDFSPITHFRVQIDTVVPHDFIPAIEGETVEGKHKISLRFSAEDELSGIASYRAKFDDGEWREISSPYEMTATDLTAKQVTVQAKDRAGNTKDAVLDLMTPDIKALQEAVPYVPTMVIQSPILEVAGQQKWNYRLFTQKQVLRFQGVAMPLAKVDLYIRSEEAYHTTVLADATGEWAYDLTQSLSAGEHYAYAVTTVGDISSAPSAPMNFTLSTDFVSESQTRPWVRIALPTLGVVLIVSVIELHHHWGKKKKKKISRRRA